MAFDFIGDLSNLLGISNAVPDPNFSDPLNMGTASVPSGLDFSALGGVASPTSLNMTDLISGAAGGGGGGGWASWLGPLTQLLGVGYLGMEGFNQMNAQQDAYSTWQQAQRNLLAQAQGMQPGITQDWQALWQQAQQNAALQRQVANMALNPAAMMQRAQGFTQPLNQELISQTSAAADLNSNMAGMGQAPGAVAAARAGALAPLIQQNDQAGLNAAFSSLNPALGLPTMNQPPNFMQTLQTMSGFTPSNFSLPPDQLSNLSQLMNMFRGTYSLPQGVNF